MAEILFYSNRGRGPMIARVLSRTGGRVTLRYGMPGAKRLATTTLDEDFFDSPACGWKCRPRKARMHRIDIERKKKRAEARR